jgi:transposase
MARRYELSDAQRDATRDEPPGEATDPGRTAADGRPFVNAVLHVAKTGVPWPDPPERLGKHDTAWKRFDRRCRSGVWERPARVLGDPDLGDPDLGDPDLGDLQLDSTTVKAHPVAATGRRRPGEKKKARTRGGASAAAGAG